MKASERPASEGRALHEPQSGPPPRQESGQAEGRALQLQDLSGEGRAAAAGSGIGGGVEGGAELAGGEDFEGAEAGVEFGGGEATVAVEAAEEIGGVAFAL